jgi:hypothetical protein
MHGNFFGWGRIIRKIKKSEFNNNKHKNNIRYITLELPGFADFLEEIGFEKVKDNRFKYEDRNLDFIVKMEIFEYKENGKRSVSPIYFKLTFESKKGYKDSVCFKIIRDYKKFYEEKDNKIIVLPVYSTFSAEHLRYGEYEGYINSEEKYQIYLTNENSKYSLKKEHLELNRRIINSKYWKFPLIEFREIYFPHQKVDEDLFNIFSPMEINNKYILCVPIYIKSFILNKLQRFKLHEEISDFLDFVSLIVCIIYSLSLIKHNYLELIEKRLFKPWYLNLSKNLKECEDMDRLPFVDIIDIDEIVYLALSIFESQKIHYMKVDKEILIESINIFMRELYKDHEKIERKVNHFIQIHENMPIAVLTAIGVVIGLMQIKDIILNLIR